MKKYYFTFASFLAAIVCWMAYGIIGSEIAPDGTLVEPFYLIPFTWLFLLAGLIGIVAIIVSRIRNRQ